MLFKTPNHEQRFWAVLGEMNCHDAYHLSAAYLIALDLYPYRYDVFDFGSSRIKPYTSLKHGWQTSSTAKTTRLMQNLWNGCTSDYSDYDEYEDGFICDVSDGYAVDNIFSNWENAYCYWQAVKLRFGMEDNPESTYLRDD